MNDLQAQKVTAKAVAGLTSSPQVQAPNKNKVPAEAEVVIQPSGKELPLQDEKTVDAKARSVEVEEAVSKLNEFVQKTQRDLDFQIDDESGKTVIRVYDRITAKLVRQIPDEAALELAKKLNSEEPSLLFSAQV